MREICKQARNLRTSEIVYFYKNEKVFILARTHDLSPERNKGDNHECTSMFRTCVERHFLQRLHFTHTVSKSTSTSGRIKRSHLC